MKDQKNVSSRAISTVMSEERRTLIAGRVLVILAAAMLSTGLQSQENNQPRNMAPGAQAPRPLRAHEKAATLQPDRKQPAAANVAPDFATGAARKITGLSIAKITDASLGRPVSVVANEIVVKMRKRTDADLKDFASRHGGQVVRRQESRLEKIGYTRLKIPQGASLETVLSAIKADANVESGQANAIMRSFAVSMNDELYSAQWGLQAIHASEVWEITQGQPSVVVAVIDSGVDLDHPDLRRNLVSGWNFLSQNQPPDDDFGHGTQVAGIIAAEGNNGVGVVGVAPACKVMPVKVLDANGEGTVADVAEAIIYAADEGCRVINLSIGTYVPSDVLREAVDYAVSRNCVVVAAAGNNACDTPCFPAAYPSVISVAAVDQSSRPCFFSNRGMSIDVAAPGLDVHTTEMGAGYKAVIGTSPAAAHVSGLAALLISADGTMSNTTVRAVVSATAADLGQAGWDAETGKGLVNCLTALHNRTAAERDIGLVSVVGLPQVPLPGQTVNINALIRNHGPASSTPVALLAKQDGNVVWQTNLPPLVSKQGTELSFSWIPAHDTTNRLSVLTVEVSPCAGEVILVDNQQRLEVIITSEQIHDVAIVSAKVQSAPLEPGTPVPVVVEIVNLGNQDENEVILQSQHGKQPFTPDRTVTLLAGSRLMLSCQWTSPPHLPAPDEPAPLYRLTFGIPALEAEAAVSNNTAFLRLGYDRLASCLVPYHKVEAGKEVHQWIANEAYEYFASLVEGADIGSYLGTISGSFTVNNNDFLEGSYAEDQRFRDPLNQGTPGVSENLDPDHPCIRHFVDGADGTGNGSLWDGMTYLVVNYPSAYEQALNIWDNYTLGRYPGNKALAFYRLGHVAHLLTDMTVPAHTHNDEHDAVLGGLDDYEEFVAYSSNYTLWNYNHPVGRIQGWWNRPMTPFEDLYSVFYRTANYTEDYDSDDEDGDVREGLSAYSPP